MEKKIRRGVAIYSYSGEYGRSMDLEDCFRDMQDMGAIPISTVIRSFQMNTWKSGTGSAAPTELSLPSMVTGSIPDCSETAI